VHFAREGKSTTVDPLEVDKTKLFLQKLTTHPGPLTEESHPILSVMNNTLYRKQVNYKLEKKLRIPLPGNLVFICRKLF